MINPFAMIEDADKYPIGLMQTIRNNSISDDEKEKQINQALQDAAKLLWMYFHACQLNSGMNGMIEFPDGSYTLEFKKVHVDE